MHNLMQDEPQARDSVDNSLENLTSSAGRIFSHLLERQTLKYGVTAGHWRFLRMLWSEDGITQGELSRRVGLREATTVAALKRLERKGFVRRKKRQKDRRWNYVYLTPSAKKLEKDLLELATGVNDAALRGLTQDEVHTLRRLLTQMCKNLVSEIEKQELP